MDQDDTVNVGGLASTDQPTQQDEQVRRVSQTSSTQVPISGSVITTTPSNSSDNCLTFKEEIMQYQHRLEDEFRVFEQTLSDKDRDNKLEQMDWTDLERRYDHDMGLRIAAEHDLMNEFSARFKQFMLWMQVSNEKEAERALKRLRTRVAFVQNSEEQLQAKQQHYAKVLDAFHDAMALLGGNL